MAIVEAALVAGSIVLFILLDYYIKGCERV